VASSGGEWIDQEIRFVDSFGKLIDAGIDDTYSTMSVEEDSWKSISKSMELENIMLPWYWGRFWIKPTYQK
jgi:hypothetical protein